MAVERAYYCDGPDCGDGQPGHARTALPWPHLPSGIIEVRDEDGARHFCGWDCLMKYAAAQPIPERIEMNGGGDV